MRPSSLVAAALMAFLSGPAGAEPPSRQGGGGSARAASAGASWVEYTSRQDFFIVNFPGQPTVNDVTYQTEYGIDLPARVYTVASGSNRYTVTVVDYSSAERMHTERVRGCQGYPDTCTNRGPNELRGALDFAVSRYLQRDGRVTYYAYADTDRVEGRRIQLTNADQSRTFVAIYMHENRLYILDGTVTGATPPPALFQQSLGFFDNDGIRVRYLTVYRHGYPPPPREETRGRLAGC
jgi:hypothetical protein